MPCIEQCELTYSSCLSAGGSVAECSRRVYDPCAATCPTLESPAGMIPTRTTPSTQVQIPAAPESAVRTCPQTCGVSCGKRYDDCITGGGTNCHSQATSCMKRCYPVQVGFWSRFTSWLR